MLTNDEIVEICHSEYYATLAANPDWYSPFSEYLITRGFSKKEAKEYAAQYEFDEED